MCYSGDVVERAGTSTITVSVPTPVLAAVREASGSRGVSRFTTAALREKLAMDGLAQIVAQYETSESPLTKEEVAAASAELFGRGPAE